MKTEIIVTKKTFVLKILSSSITLAFSGMCYSQNLVYDGTSDPSKAKLETTYPLLKDSLKWMPLSATDEGIIYRTAGSTVFVDAHLSIDYSSGKIPKFVIGGFNDKNNGFEVKDNFLTIANGNVNGPVYGGLAFLNEITEDIDHSNKPVAANNMVDTRYSSSAGYNPNVSHNTVVVKDNVEGVVYAGKVTHFTQSGHAIAQESYSSTVASSNAYTDVESVGTIAYANSNIATIGDNVSIGNSIYGGHIQVNAISGNAIAKNSTASNMAINKTGSVNAEAHSRSFVDDVKATANYNTVTIGQNARSDNSVYGGSILIETTSGNATAATATANNFNIVSLYSSAVTYTEVIANAQASSNDVAVEQNANIRNSIFGGSVHINTKAGNAIGAEAKSINNLNIHAQVNAIAGASTYDTKVKANNNTVSIGQNASIGNSLYGGYVQIDNKAGNAQSGDININNGNISFIQNSEAFSEASDINATANNNIVTVGQNASIGNSIYGGSVQLGVTAGRAQSGNKIVNGVKTSSKANAFIEVSRVLLQANGNQINMDGILQSGSIFGGYIRFDMNQGEAINGDGTPGDNSVYLDDSVAQATNNVITIGKNAEFTQSNGSIYGGYLQYMPGFSPESYDLFTGNTLNYAASKPASFKSVANFEKYNFVLSPNNANSSTPLINAQDIVLGADTSNISEGTSNPSNISVVGIHSGKLLAAGDHFILMQSNATFVDNATGNTTNVSQAQQGISFLYDVRTDINAKDKQVTATIMSCQDSAGKTCSVDVNGNKSAVRVNPQLKALAEGRLSAMAQITRGADMIAYTAFDKIHNQLDGSFVPFFITDASHNRYKSGSHITSNDVLVNGGISYANENFKGAAFVEAGWGSYNSYNSFNNVANVRGNGHNRYVGYGILAKYQFDNGFYSEASIRFGRSKNAFNSNDIVNFSTGEHAKYSVHSPYTSAHIGAGYMSEIGNNNSIDLSVKYLWTYLKGKDLIVASDPIHFNSTDSKRFRIQGTFTHQYSNHVSISTGLGYEHEYSSSAQATTFKHRITAPCINGGTGIVTIGAIAKPREQSPWQFDVKAQGYTGKRQGGALNLLANYFF